MSNSADTLVVAVSFCLVIVSMMSKSSLTPGILHTFLTMSSVITLYASRSALMYGDSFKWLNLASEKQASRSAASSAEAVAWSSECLAAAFSALLAHLSFAHLAVITEMIPFLHADIAGSAPAYMAFFSSGVGGAYGSGSSPPSSAGGGCACTGGHSCNSEHLSVILLF